MTKGALAFYSVGKEYHNLIQEWLRKEHVKPFFYGQGLKSTLRNLSLFIKGVQNNGDYSFEHWIACIDDYPFAFLMTSEVEGPYDPKDPYDKWYEEGKVTITLDLLIGEEAFLGKGLASRMIQEFLLDKYSHASKVLIDPAEENQKAIHVYEKAGFEKVETFSQTHDDPQLCWMMHLKMKELKRQVPVFVPQFELKPSKGDVSFAFYQLGLKTYHEAVNWARQLPYGRNSDRTDYRCVFSEGKGTCSTKHAVLAALAQEYAQPIKLKMVICKLDENLDPNVRPFLDLIDAKYFPEAHCFLACRLGRLDITFPGQSPFPKVEILEEFFLSPEDIGERKQQLHHDYIKKWMKIAISKDLTFDDLWNLREKWIESLSQLTESITSGNSKEGRYSDRSL